MERDGLTSALESVGATVLANACGPCIGQWKRPESKEENAILTSFNRNFKSRNDGNQKTMNFLASPSIVTAMAFSGKLSFNPITDTITTPSGEQFKFSAPVGKTLPDQGFEAGAWSIHEALQTCLMKEQAIPASTPLRTRSLNLILPSSFRQLLLG